MGNQRIGFSLIELMMVVTILAIIACIAVPRLVDASENARESALGTDLTMLRRQIDLYKLQHANRPPHLDENGNADTANFIARLTGRTDRNGKVDANGEFGPYVTEWPTNPFCPDGIAGTVSFGPEAAPPRDDSTGWHYSTQTHVISPNSGKGGEDLDPEVSAFVPNID